MVWSDAAVTVEATPLKNQETGAEDTDAFTIAIPANSLLEVPSIIPGKTKITMTAI